MGTNFPVGPSHAPKYAKVEELKNERGQVIGQAFYKRGEDGQLSLYKTKQTVDEQRGLFGSGSKTEVTSYANGDRKVKQEDSLRGLFGGTTQSNSVKYKADGSVETKSGASTDLFGTTLASGTTRARFGRDGGVLDVMQTAELGGQRGAWGWASDATDSRSADYQRKAARFTGAKTPDYQRPAQETQDPGADAPPVPPKNRPKATTGADAPRPETPRPADDPGATPEGQGPTHTGAKPAPPKPEAPKPEAPKPEAPKHDFAALDAHLSVLHKREDRAAALEAAKKIDPGALDARYGKLGSTSTPLAERQALAREFMGLDANASPEAARKAYKQLALLMHPDKSGNGPLFQVLQNSASVLGAA